MRFEVDIYHPSDLRAFATFLNAMADRADAEPKDGPPPGVMPGLGTLMQQAVPLDDSDGGRDAAEPTENAEAPKRTRGRPKKAEAPAPAPTEEPEQTEEPEAAESASEMPDDIFETAAPAPATRQDVVDAMKRHAEKFGLAETSKNKVKLLGAEKVGGLPEDPAVFAAAIARFDAAVAAGVAGGA